MISLSHSIETQTQDRTVTDEGGNETTETVSVTMLKITVSQKNSVDMTAEYGFSEAQMEQFHELLNPKYSDMWATLIQ